MLWHRPRAHTGPVGHGVSIDAISTLMPNLHLSVHHSVAQTISAVVPVVGTIIALVFVQNIVARKISTVDGIGEKIN